MRSLGSLNVPATQGLMALITIRIGNNYVFFSTYRYGLKGYFFDPSIFQYRFFTWMPAPGAAVTNIQFPSDGTPASCDVTIMADGTIFKPGDGVSGKLDGCPIAIEIFDPSQTDAGGYVNNRFSLIPGAFIGTVVENARGIITMSVEGPLSRWLKPAAERYSLTGREDLGDDRCKVPVRPSYRVPNVIYVLPSIETGLLHVDDAYMRVRVGTNGTVEDFRNLYWECTVSGYTGYASWATGNWGGGSAGVGSVVNDNSGGQPPFAQFIARDSWVRYARGQAIGDYQVRLTYLPDPRATDPTWYQLGALYIQSGDWSGTPRIPIRLWDPNSLIVTTFLPLPVDFLPADTQFEITPGCDLTREMCNSRFNNIINLRAETFVPPGTGVTVG